MLKSRESERNKERERERQRDAKETEKRVGFSIVTHRIHGVFALNYPCDRRKEPDASSWLTHRDGLRIMFIYLLLIGNS